MRKVLVATAIVASIAAFAAQAQGVVGGAVGVANGAVGVAAGAVGAATGIAGGVLGVDSRPRFREYVGRERRPSYAYQEDLRVGSVLPGAGVTYYDVPADYGVRGYRYTVVNNRTVLVDPVTHRVVEIID